MKKHLVMSLLCFFITCAFFLSCESDIQQNETEKHNIYLENVSLKDAIEKFNEIKYLEEEREVIEDSARYIVVYKINRVKRPRVVKYKKVFIRPKFRVQSARSIIGDEGFANI